MIKVVSVSAADTQTKTYSYDASKRLIKVTSVGISSGDKVEDSDYCIRVANDKLIQHTNISYLIISSLPLKYDTIYYANTYDSKRSPLQYGIESFIGLGENYAGPNNILSLLVTDKSNCSNSVSFNYTLAYNTNAYPAATANGTATV